MRVALAAFLLLAAGCLAPVDPSAETQGAAPAADGLLYRVSGDLLPTDGIEALELSSSEGRYLTTWSPRDAIGRDSMHLLLLQATGPTHFVLHDQQEVQFSGNADRLLEVRETACAAQVIGPGTVGDGDPPAQPVPGEYLVAMASGQMHSAPPALLDVDVARGAVYGGGPQVPGVSGGAVGGGGHREGDLQADEWMLWGAGLSGVGGLDIHGSSVLRFNLTTDVPMRIVELPPTTLHCGMGFSALQNATFHTAGPGFHLGGALALESLYGGAFEWNDICWPLDGPWPFNRARLDLNGTSTDLTQATLSMTQGTFSTEPGQISVEHWKGHPMWTFVGLPLALRPLPATEMIGCLQ